MRASKKTAQEVQTDYLRFLGASNVEFMETDDEVIVIATFDKQFVLQPYDLDALEQLIGCLPDIGFDNSGTDKETVDMRCPDRLFVAVELCLIVSKHTVLSDISLCLTHSDHLFSVLSVAGFDLTPR